MSMGGKGDQPPTEVTLRKADSKAMKEMAATLREMTGVVRDLYGMPAPAAEGAKRQRTRMSRKAASSCSDKGRASPAEEAAENAAHVRCTDKDMDAGKADRQRKRGTGRKR